MHDIWNPWHGCTKCSPGCQNCYMYALDAMREVQTPSDLCRKTGSFNYPLQKSRKTKAYKVRPGERIRVNMTSDTFIDKADEWRPEMWNIIRKRPDVIFWLLTKRPERIKDHLPEDWGDGWENVVMNVTCENQDMFTKRYPYLLELPAKHKGFCLAPLISDIDVSPALESGQIEEVSVGGENYNNPRPCRYEWVKHIADTCAKYRTNFFWYETGTNFWLGDIQYWMPDKHKQSTEAWFAGLNQKYYDVKFDLRYEDGAKVLDDDLYKRVYNLDHCVFCSNQDMCNGCSQCGSCNSCRIADRDTFLRVQQEMLNQHRGNR